MALDVQTAASDRRLDGRVDLKRRLKKYVNISARVDVMPGTWTSIIETKQVDESLYQPISSYHLLPP